ncbi:MAG TPA: 50S ribosomal protein L10 [Myxococcota bacterium]|jgi:large subunit ribosomal protein L10|nr:50S ribosomal protein L10 [Myxococcota bacterium]
MLRSRKDEIIAGWQKKFPAIAGAVIADFRGMTVAKITELRRLGRPQGVAVQVISNRLFRRATAGSPWEKVAKNLTGTNALLWHPTDPVAPAKVALEFLKTNESVTVKGGLLAGEAYDKAGVEAFSKLPGKNELRATLLATFQAPAQSFVRLVAAAPTNFLYLLQAREKALAAETK